MGKVCIDLTRPLADLEAANHRLSAEVDELRLAESKLSIHASIVESSEDAIISETLDGEVDA